MARFGNPLIPYRDNSNKILDGGQLTFFATGTTTKLDTFLDVNLKFKNTNPVICNAAGYAGNIFLKPQAYKVRLEDKNDVLIGPGEVDPIAGDLATGAFSPWNALTIFNIPDIVTASDGRFYRSIVDNNGNNDPAAPSPSQWMEVEFISTFNANFTFRLGQITKASDNLLYSSTIADNLNNDPTTDKINWQPASSGTVPDAVLAAGFIFANNNF